ncbi:hypothetical protein KP803_20700 [Vibrio sp. ZSDE26]|uniref:Uncharacterized protein n=1 Tax=Vibrio amylolyticus TaxID=2847292 RepID=A0A9X1XMW3_9VIBR|nr:hypothetical protein [Vibrio amylolyticus]MCK6265681.1 hypothetical protein [Vibrio amylolyticus]
MEDMQRSKAIVILSSITFLVGFLFLMASEQKLAPIIMIHISFCMFVLHADVFRSSSKGDDAVSGYQRDNHIS